MAQITGIRSIRTSHGHDHGVLFGEVRRSCEKKIPVGKVGKQPSATMFESAAEGAAEPDVKVFPWSPQCRRGPVRIADS
jgi:hypothetical protein